MTRTISLHEKLFLSGQQLTVTANRSLIDQDAILIFTSIIICIFPFFIRDRENAIGSLIAGLASFIVIYYFGEEVIEWTSRLGCIVGERFLDKASPALKKYLFIYDDAFFSWFSSYSGILNLAKDGSIGLLFFVISMINGLAFRTILAFLPFLAVLSVLPPFRNILNGLVSYIFFIFLYPIYLAFILLIFDDMFYSNLTERSSFADTIGWFLVLTFAMGWGAKIVMSLISKGGVANAVASSGMMASTVLANSALQRFSSLPSSSLGAFTRALMPSRKSFKKMDNKVVQFGKDTMKVALKDHSLLTGENSFLKDMPLNNILDGDFGDIPKGTKRVAKSDKFSPGLKDFSHREKAAGRDTYDPKRFHDYLFMKNPKLTKGEAPILKHTFKDNGEKRDKNSISNIKSKYGSESFYNNRINFPNESELPSMSVKEYHKRYPEVKEGLVKYLENKDGASADEIFRRNK